MEFKIGDKIKVIPYEELPEKRKSKGVARACGREGVIIDKLYSSKENRYIYKVQLETFNAPSSIGFTDDMLRFAGGYYPYAESDNRTGRSGDRAIQGRHKAQAELRSASVRRRVRNRASGFVGSKTTYAQL